MVVINAAQTEKETRFRWTYIALPAALFLLAIILAACFYPFLPDEIAYHFQDGSPDNWLSRGAFLGWMVIPQVFFAFFAIIIVRLVMLTSRYLPQQRQSPLASLLPVMGNMIALPQIILVFAMLDFFLYNIYQIKLIPLWVITLIVLLLGAVVLAIFFIRTIRRNRRQQANIRQE